MSTTNIKTAMRERRHHRIRAKVHGTADKPRLAVFRSNTAIYAQLINDEKRVTIAAADSRKASGNTRERARNVGKMIGEAAKQAGVTKAVFDRGGFLYTGAVKELAEGARAAGLAM